MTALRKPERMDVETFLDFAEDRPDHERWELFDGVPVMMTNPNIRHGTIAGNLMMKLGPIARARGCQIFAGDIKVRDPANQWFAGIPDLLIRCGSKPAGTENTLTHPTILIEILSPSTKARDLADKFIAYTAMDSLQMYIILYQDEMRAEVWQRRPAGAKSPPDEDTAPAQGSGRGWDNLTLTRPGDTLHLPPIDTALTLAQIYEDTDLAA